MTHARTIAALAIAIATTLVPQAIEIDGAPAPARTVIETVEVEPIAPLAEVETDDIIDGIRIATEDPQLIALVTDAVQRFDRAGWPLTNTEVRFDAEACDGAVAYHAEENGHHVVVMCTVVEWALLHELAHVWSDLYLGESERGEWLERRGLESWGAGAWHERGTEHAAEIIAFGLYDTPHAPSSIADAGYRTLTEDFEWLMGVEPVHRQRG